MLRGLRILLIFLTIAGAFAWVAFYIWITALACGFGNTNPVRCTTPAPWDLRGEDLRVLVILPGLIMATLVAAVALIGRALQRRDS